MTPNEKVQSMLQRAESRLALEMAGRNDPFDKALLRCEILTLRNVLAVLEEGQMTL